jgi:hypothetical protein
MGAKNKPDQYVDTIERAAQEYRERKYTVISVLTKKIARLIVSDALTEALKGYGHRRDVQDGEIVPGGDRRHTVIDGLIVAAAVPDLMEIYDHLLPILRQITGKPVIRSPYPRSAVNVKIFGVGDSHGWHYDTNALTALLSLNTCGSGGTEIDFQDGREIVTVPCETGNLLIMDGRDLWHRGAPVERGDIKINAPLNYYYEGDTNRPEWADRLMYGEGVK